MVLVFFTPALMVNFVSQLDWVIGYSERGVCVCVCTCVHVHACACAGVCVRSIVRPTLCHPMDCSPPGISVHGVLQARILEWVAVFSSRGIFPTQELKMGLLHGRQILYHLSHQGSPLRYMVKQYSGCFSEGSG